MQKIVHVETRLKGLPLSNGLAVARVCMFNDQRHSNLPMYHVAGEGIEGEANRVVRAIRIAADRLEKLRAQVQSQIGKAEAEIFVAQRMILEDPGIAESVLDTIRNEGLNAESAVSRALDAYEARILELDNAYIKERATDIGELKRRLLDVLGNMRPSLQCDEAHCQKGRSRIVVAEELTPTLIVELDTGHTMGFVTERGGLNSHAAILARALGVPAVSGVARIRDLVGCGHEILLNGNTGEVVLWPSEKTVAEARAAHPEGMRMPKPAGPVPGLKVMANVSVAADIAEALALRAEGIGLYRTEMEWLASEALPAEDDLAKHYASVLDAMKSKPVVFRMLDIGSDKKVAFLNIPREDNPALGWRGARLLLAERDILALQARALARASRSRPLSVMYPMIVDLAQFLALRDAFREATAHIPCGRIRHGVMFEVPSACLRAAEILEHADFGSIGTNDLTQYLCAVDRNNAKVAHDFRGDHPALWDMMAMVVRAARAAGKPLSVCGEIAGDPACVPRLVDLGVKTLSVSPRSIPSVRAVAVSLKRKRGASRGKAGQGSGRKPAAARSRKES